MKTIGLIGGMSWESTVTYYQIINKTIREKLGGLHSAKLLLYSVDFARIEKLQTEGRWDEIADILGAEAQNLEKAGADFIVICANTTHKIAPQIQEKISIPILHIADATSQELKKNKIKKAALIGTKYTILEDFYKDRIRENGIDLIIPNEKDVELINNVIYSELCVGEIKENSKKEYIRIIGELKKQGAEAVIFGCTEIGLLVSKEDSPLPVYDTTEIHAYTASMKALD